MCSAYLILKLGFLQFVKVNVLYRLMRAKVFGIGFLHDSIATVFFISENAAYRSGRPVAVDARWSVDEKKEFIQMIQTPKIIENERN